MRAAALEANLVIGGGTTPPSLASGGEKVFDFAGKRLEGQFIFAVGTTVITVNLHAFDGGSSCEVRGTAETASM